MKKIVLMMVVAVMVCAVCFALDIRKIITQELSVNYYTTTEYSEKGVKALNLYSSSVNYMVSFNGVDFITLPSQSSLNLNNLDIINFTLYIKGATETDTGTVQMVLMK